jgi:hypothetical protein
MAVYEQSMVNTGNVLNVAARCGYHPHRFHAAAMASQYCTFTSQMPE